VPPPLLERAAVPAGKRRRATTFPHVVAPPNSLLSATVCLSCRPPHLSSVFPCRSPLSRKCLSAADVGRLPRPRLRHLDVAGEDPSPCVTSSPHRPCVRVAPACRRLPSTSVQSRRHAAGVARGRTPRVHEPRALAMAWAAFQRQSLARGSCPTFRGPHASVDRAVPTLCGQAMSRAGVRVSARWPLNYFSIF
jgi:hypothetical protein